VACSFEVQPFSWLYTGVYSDGEAYISSGTHLIWGVKVLYVYGIYIWSTGFWVILYRGPCPRLRCPYINHSMIWKTTHLPAEAVVGGDIGGNGDIGSGSESGNISDGVSTMQNKQTYMVPYIVSTK